MRLLLAVRLSPEGRRRLAEVTAVAEGRRLAVVVDGEVVAAPRIHEPIPDGLVALTLPFDTLDTAVQVRELSAFARTRVASALRASWHMADVPSVR